MKKYLLYLISLLFFLLGTALTAFYAYEAFLVIGTADYSIVFWYLPILFLGLGAFMLSSILYRMAKKSRIVMLDEVDEEEQWK